MTTFNQHGNMKIKWNVDSDIFKPQIAQLIENH